MQIKTFLLSIIMVVADATALPQGEAARTTTLTVLAKLDLSSVTTIYIGTHTATTSIDCHGCDTLSIKTIGGHGPVRRITATVIDDSIRGTTTTTTVCSATPT